ncbi:MAG: hypothetical protein J1D87_07965 [Lachnospiraceae bacterium]|nr:hypothetical protein [Lachnospiraceae bacterium]
MDRNINIVTNAEDKKIVIINDILFKGKRKEDWDLVEMYLKEYVGNFYEMEATSEKIFISSDFPDEYSNSENRIRLKGAVAKAKANASQGIPELIRIATNGKYSVNTKKKHSMNAKYGWYRYEIKFALPVLNDQTRSLERYNIYSANMLVRHANDGKKYLYDILDIKKETSSPLES